MVDDPVRTQKGAYFYPSYLPPCLIINYLLLDLFWISPSFLYKKEKWIVKRKRENWSHHYYFNTNISSRVTIPSLSIAHILSSLSIILLLSRSYPLYLSHSFLSFTFSLNIFRLSFFSLNNFHLSSFSLRTHQSSLSWSLHHPCSFITNFLLLLCYIHSLYTH